MNFKLFCIIFEISIMLIINFLAKKKINIMLTYL